MYSILSSDALKCKNSSEGLKLLTETVNVSCLDALAVTKNDARVDFYICFGWNMEKWLVSKEFYYNWLIIDKQDNLNCIPSLITKTFVSDFA